MKSFLKALGVVALAGLLVTGTVTTAAAAPVITLSPSTQTVFDEAFSVDILVSGLDGTAAGAVGAFSAILSFDDSLITGVSYTVDPDDKLGVALDPLFNDASFGFAGGSGSPLDLYFVADISLDGDALLGLQGIGFRLATLFFQAGQLQGLSPLNFLAGSVVLSDADGIAMASSSQNGSVCVSRDGSQGPCTAVPEPGLMALLATGLVTAAARRRRKA